MAREYIRPGDVFVRHYGNREQVHVFLTRPRSRKRNYMRLSANSVDSTWSSYHTDYTYNGWRYVGTIPPAYLHNLEMYWTLR